MNIITNKVTGFHNNSVGDDINTFIKDFQSENTQKSYKRNLEMFFMWYKNKELSLLTKEDLVVRNADLKKYRNYLKELPIRYSNSSINQMIAAIQSLYHFLAVNDYPVNPKATELTKLPETENQTGELYFHEAERMAEVVKHTPKGQEKSALIRMAYTTSFRKDSILSLQWEDIEPTNNPDIYMVSVIGKGHKKHSVPISASLYQELLKIKQLEYYQQYSDNKIFHLSKTTIQSMMDWLLQKLEIPSHRNIKFHSFRNVAVMFGTLEEAKQHLNHSSISVTEKSYRHKNKDISNSLSLRMEESVDDSIFEFLSKEELINLIQQQNEGIKFTMKHAAQKIVEERVND